MSISLSDGCPGGELRVLSTFHNVEMLNWKSSTAERMGYVVQIVLLHMGEQHVKHGGPQ